MRDGQTGYDYDFIVIGSGFGGSVSALRLSEKGYRVAVLEMGRRWDFETLPRRNWSLSRWLWWPTIGWRGFFSIRLFRHMMVLHGNAVGGGSITYANTHLVPKDGVWDKGTWAGLEDWKTVLPEHFATAKRMLGVTQNRILGHADHKLRAMAEACGVAHTFYRTQVGVLFAQDGDAPGTVYSDPFFDGEGPSRAACIGCGGCMIGCRYDAKNTLDKNYLFLAEKCGAEVFAETKVTGVTTRGGLADGSEGYNVYTGDSTVIFGARERSFTCRGIVFAASSLGTQELLFRLKQGGSLPNISDALGEHVRTNAESLIGVRYPGSSEDLSEGIAIGSGIYLDEHTNIQATRYPRGSDAVGLLLTVMTRGRQGRTRILMWLWTLLRLFLMQPVTTLRTLMPFGFARESVILLCMQEANAFAVKAAKATGGVAATSVTEILFNVPTTAHCMGGAVMATSPAEGVCDSRNRVFGYRNMFICDGSVLSANLGVNPSLTITALTEHAMSHVPRVEQQTWDAWAEHT
jgi:cholesterol oxidase